MRDASDPPENPLRDDVEAPSPLLKATRLHYIFARDFPARIWPVTFSLVAVAISSSQGWSLLVSPTQWVDPLIFLGNILLAALLGYSIGILLGWPILGPLYYSRSLKNGEPFRVGEQVQILVGPHQDRVVYVLKTSSYAEYAGAHEVHVKLSEQEDAEEAVFSAIEVLRVSEAPKDSPGDPVS